MRVAAILVLASIGLAGCGGGDSGAALQRYVASGDGFMAERKYQEAVVQYRNAVREDARHGQARLKLAAAYVAVGDGRNALREAVRAADLMPDSVEAQLRAGSLLLVARQYPEARTRAEAAIAKDPKNAQAHLLLGNALARLKDIDGAIEQVEEAIDQNPQLTLSYANLGALLLAKNDREAAEAAFRQAVIAAPKSVDARLALANFLWASRRLPEAEQQLKDALALDAKSATANRALAAYYVSQRQPEVAEPYLRAYAEVSGDVQSQLVLADFYVSRSNTAEATRILNALVQQPGGATPATVRLAGLDFAGNKRPAAYARLDALLKERPRDGALLESKAQFLLIDGKPKDALAITGPLVENNNRRTQRARYLHGLALEATGSIDMAVRTFRELLVNAPSSTPVQTKLALLSLRQGDYKEALSLAQQVVKADFRSPQAHFLYAQALLKSGDLVNAERELMALQKLAPNSADVHTWVGFLQEAKRDVNGARRSYERALALESENTGALAGLVSVDLAAKNPDAALARIESRLAAKPNDLRLVSMSGMVYLETRNLAKAEAAYLKVIELDPNNIEAYGRLGAIYVAQRRLDEALVRFGEMAKRQEKPVAAETMIGTILARQNKPAEARKHFERALQFDSRAAVAANNLAWDYASNGGNLDVALQLAQTAKAELPEVAEVTDTLGWIYYKKQLNSLAVTTFREALQQNPNNPRIQYRLGLAHLQNGDKVEARSALERSLQMNPSTADAAETRRVLATIQG